MQYDGLAPSGNPYPLYILRREVQEGMAGDSTKCPMTASTLFSEGMPPAQSECLFWIITSDFGDEDFYAWRTVCHQNHTLLEGPHRQPPKPIVGFHEPGPYSPKLRG